MYLTLIFFLLRLWIRSLWVYYFDGKTASIPRSFKWENNWKILTLLTKRDYSPTKASSSSTSRRDENFAPFFGEEPCRTSLLGSLSPVSSGASQNEKMKKSTRVLSGRPLSVLPDLFPKADMKFRVFFFVLAKEVSVFLLFRGRMSFLFDQ